MHNRSWESQVQRELNNSSLTFLSTLIFLPTLDWPLLPTSKEKTVTLGDHGGFSNLFGCFDALVCLNFKHEVEQGKKEKEKRKIQICFISDYFACYKITWLHIYYPKYPHPFLIERTILFQPCWSWNSIFMWKFPS